LQKPTAPPSVPASAAEHTMMATRRRGIQTEPARDSAATCWRELDQSESFPIAAVRSTHSTGDAGLHALQHLQFKHLTLLPPDAGRRGPEKSSDLMHRQQGVAADEVQHLLVSLDWDTMCSAARTAALKRLVHVPPTDNPSRERCLSLTEGQTSQLPLPGGLPRLLTVRIRRRNQQ
jgi:hypothetical protein